VDPVAAFRLDEQVAIVTGASSGLGKRFAHVLSAAGARVAVAARRDDRLRALAGHLQSQGGEVLPVPCDVTDQCQVDSMVAAVRDSFGGVDVLVNAAGIGRADAEEIESPRSFRRVLDVNTTGTYICTLAAARAMLSRDRGAVVNVASISGLVAGDGFDTPSYTASKGAIVSLTRELGVRWASRGVRVNAIAPGWFQSEMTAETLASEEGMRFVTERTPLGRPGAEYELDGALLFLASDASSYVTGQTVVVDGGWTAR